MGCGASTEKKYVIAEAQLKETKEKLTTEPAAVACGSIQEPLAGVADAPDGPSVYLYYYDFAGRGELSRLIAAYGGIALREYSSIDEPASFGSPGLWPCLEHGSLKISQSFAIEQYLAGVVPKFAELTAAQRAVDCMFAKIKEDMLAAYNAIIMSDDEEAEAPQTMFKDMVGIGERWFPVVERKLPEAGFINGLAFPTVADLAVLNMAKAFIPFGAAFMICDYDVSGKFPKFSALVERVEAVHEVKAYIDRSKSLDADPLDFQAMMLSPMSSMTMSLGMRRYLFERSPATPHGQASFSM